MDDVGLTRRVLGLSVPVTEMLDPSAWRQRYAYGIALGPSSGGSGQRTSDLAQMLCRGEGKKSLVKEQDKLKDAQTQISELVDSLPDDVIRWHLRAAVSELEMKLGIPLGVVVYKGTPVAEGLIQGVHFDREYSRKPFLQGHAKEWYKIDLPSNVISIERVRAFWFGQVVWEISAERDNMDMVKLEWPKASSAHIIPTTMSNVLITAPGLGGGSYGAWQMFSGTSKVPDVWSVDFTAGPRDQYGRVGHVEAALAHWCYAVAGILLLSMGGLARSQGLTSASISMDGLSRSIGLQASAIYGINSALEKALEDATKRIDWKAVRTYKRGLRVVPYGR